MYIAKGPYQSRHQQRALSQVVQAHIFQQASSENLEQFYLALINLEQYMEKLCSNDRAAKNGYA